MSLPAPSTAEQASGLSQNIDINIIISLSRRDNTLISILLIFKTKYQLVSWSQTPQVRIGLIQLNFISETLFIFCTDWLLCKSMMVYTENMTSVLYVTKGQL